MAKGQSNIAKGQGKFVGVDLGTTFSAIAYLNAHGQCVTVKNREGQPVTPSAVMISPDRDVLVGSKALAIAESRPDLVATNFKRDMGDSFYHRKIGGREFSPEALSALVLRRLRDDFEEQVGPVAGAVITVPAYFGDVRRKATQDAGHIASLDVIDIINEPTAAALANAFRQFIAAGGSAVRFEVAAIASTAPSTTLVFDLGGGTFDVTVIRIDGDHFNVLATGGEVRLGGVDFDARLAHHLADEFARRNGLDPRDDEAAYAKLLATAEKAKIELTSATQTAIRLQQLGRATTIPMTRDIFEQLTADLLTRIQMSVEVLLEDALLSWDRIDDILLVGGSSRMPMINKMLQKISGKRPNMATAPEQIVAHGAAIHAAIRQLEAPRAVTVTVDGARRLTHDTLTEQEPDDPNEDILSIFQPAVAEAAQRVRLTDVNSHSLGIIARSPRENRLVNSVVIPANTPLPTSRTKTFGAEVENQRVVRVLVVEGESRDPRGCVQIGECVIRDLPKGLPKGAPVDVTFEYKADGRIHVEAVQVTSGARAEAGLTREFGFDQKTLEALSDAVSGLTVQ